MTFTGRHLLSLLAGSVIFVMAARADEQAAKMAIPDAAAQQNAQKLVQEVFGDELARAKSAPDRALLARKIFHEADATRDNPVARYVLLARTLDLAAGAGDTKTAMAAIDDIDQGWITDALKMRADALSKMAPAIRQTADPHEYVQAALSVVDQGIAQDRYDIAKNINALALAAAGPARDPELVKQLNARGAQITEMAAAYETIGPALATFKANPSDPSANLIVGKFECFMKGRWEVGLPKLAIAGDPAIQAMVMKDHAGANSPEAQTELGDAWWELGEHESVTAQIHIRLRAAAWYAKAAPHLTGLLQIKAQTREKEATAGDLRPPEIADRPAEKPPIAIVPPRAPSSLTPPAAVAGNSTNSPTATVIKVVNHTDAKEAESVISSIAADFPDVVKGASEVELLKYHNASELHRNYGGPRVLAGAYSSSPVAGGRGGMMLWGVYEKWDAGNYLIVYRVQGLSQLEGNKICFLDVCHKGGTIASRRPNADEFKPNTWACMPITLNLKSEKEIEYRLWPDKHTIALDRIYVFRITASP